MTRLVRDHRRAPFTWVLNDALALIREKVPERAQPYVRSTYVALAEASSLALDGEHRKGADKKTLAMLAGLSTRRVQEHLDTLASLGLVVIQAQSDGGKVLPNLYVLTEGASLDETSTLDTSASETSRPTRAGDSRTSKKEETSPGEIPEEVGRLAVYLARKVRSNGFTSPDWEKPLPAAWTDPLRLMLSRDRMQPEDAPWTVEEIRAVIDWAAADEFWKANIRSATKLRSHRDLLRVKMKQSTASAIVGKVNGARNGVGGHSLAQHAMRRAQEARANG